MTVDVWDKAEEEAYSSSLISGLGDTDNAIS